MDIAEVIKKSARKEGAELIGFTDLENENVVVLGFSKNSHTDLEVIDKKASNLIKKINKMGFTSRLISASDGDGISLRHLAEKAGLGFVGRSGLLITERFGPDVRLSAIITCAMLPINGSDPIDRCGTCLICLRSCPAEAIEKRDIELCRSKVLEMGLERCTVCIDVCPFKR